MPTRIGIELSASECRIVEVQTRRTPAGAPGDTRVRAFRVLRWDDDDPAARANELRRVLSGTRRGWGPALEKRFSRRAPIAVTLWGLPSTLQFLRLPPAAPADLEALARREAKRDIEALSTSDGEASVGIALGTTAAAPGGAARREVALVAASSTHLRKRLQPLADAGVTIDAVVTPALALASIARLRRGATPAAAHGYVALGAQATALAIVRDGMLLFAREIPWGHETGVEPGGSVDRARLADRLASELRRSFLFFKQKFRADVDFVAICGDLPDLRTLTAPLIVALDIEIETLDSMEGIDVTALPSPPDEFRERIAELRLAWAVAADPAPAINLLPRRARVERAARRGRLALAAGLAAAVAIGTTGFMRADGFARAEEKQRQALEREVAALTPRVASMEAARREQALDGARRAALTAFDTQGVRLARALEVIARATPPEIVLNGIKVSAAGAVWRASLNGVAISVDPGAAQAAVNEFLRHLHGSPYLGPPSASPTLRMVSGGQLPERSGAGGEDRPAATTIPAGMSGIEFSVQLEIRK